MAEAFSALSPADRAAIQQELQGMGLYAGPIDGLWGQGALVGVHDAWLSTNHTGGPVTSGAADEGTAFPLMIASGELGDHLKAWRASGAVGMD